MNFFEYLVEEVTELIFVKKKRQHFGRLAIRISMALIEKVLVFYGGAAAWMGISFRTFGLTSVFVQKG